MTRFALAAASICILTAAAIAAVPTPTPPTPMDTVPPATAPGVTATLATAPAATATAPATLTADETAAKKALNDFFTAMFNGDQATAFGLLTYPADPKNPQKVADAKKMQATAEVMFGEILAEQNLHNAVNKAFPDKANTFETGMGPQDIKDFYRTLDTATVALSDAKDVANIQMGPGPTFVLIKGTEGNWKIDFDKTQTNMGPLPTNDTPMLAKKAAAYNQIAKDVASGKVFASIEDVTKAVDKADEDAAKAEATTAPATNPTGPEAPK